MADNTDGMQKGVDGGVTELIVSNLPTLNGNGNSRVQIRARLTQLGNNCRGRVVRIMHDGRALIRFPSHEAMLRLVVWTFVNQTTHTHRGALKYFPIEHNTTSVIYICFHFCGIKLHSSLFLIIHTRCLSCCSLWYEVVKYSWEADWHGTVVEPL